MKLKCAKIIVPRNIIVRMKMTASEGIINERLHKKNETVKSFVSNFQLKWKLENFVHFLNL